MTNYSKRSPFAQILFSDSAFKGCITLKTHSLPYEGNTAFQVAKTPEALQAVMENRNLLAQETLPVDCWVLGRQSHGNKVQRVTQKDASKGSDCLESAFENTDALYTTEPDLLIGVHTADCLGILLYDPKLPVAAVVHSGWKGTAGAVLARTLDALQNDGLLNPENLHVLFSPSLAFDSLEVGPEVIEAVQKMAAAEKIDIDKCIKPGKGDRFYLDNEGVNIQIARNYGISSRNIFSVQMDTLTDDRCFSFRKDKPLGGEHFTCCWLTGKAPSH